MTTDDEHPATLRPEEHHIKHATGVEMKRVAEILADAFTNDPVVQWICGDPGTSVRMFRYLAESKYKFHGHVYINKTGAGAAMWLPPGVDAKTPFHWRLLPALWRMLRKCGPDGLKRMELVQNLMARNHITEPHFYLHIIGVCRNGQGQGIGSALLKAGLAACDRVGTAAYLETATEKNVALYRRFGFEIIGEEEAAEGAPTMWFMKRQGRIEK